MITKFISNFVIMSRPVKPFKPLTGYTGDYNYAVRSIDLIRAIVKKALHERLWVFDPSTKRWFNPEEFMQLYERHENIDTKWIDKIEIRDPIDGLEAADQQIESILSRKAVLAKKIIEYWKNKK